MAPNNDIENQFSSAVKSALDASGPVAPPSEAPTSPLPAVRPKRSHAWGVALLCLACTAIAVVVVVTVLQVRRVGVAPSEVEVAATRPNGDSTAPAGSTPAGCFEPDDYGHDTGADRRCAGFNGEYQQRTATTPRHAVGSFATCPCVAARTPACGYVKEGLGLSSNAPSSFSGRASFCPWSPVSFVKPIRKGAKPGL